MTFNPSHLLIARNNPRSPAQPHITAPTPSHLFPAQHIRDGIMTRAGSAQSGSEDDDVQDGERGPPPIDMHHTFKGLSPMAGTVEIVVQGQSFWCHKEVLYFASPFFEDALSGGWAETSLRPQSCSSSLITSVTDETAHPTGQQLDPLADVPEGEGFETGTDQEGDDMPESKPQLNEDPHVVHSDSGGQSRLSDTAGAGTGYLSTMSHLSNQSDTSSPNPGDPDLHPDRSLAPSRLSRLSRSVPIYIDEEEEVVQGGSAAEEIRRNLGRLREGSESRVEVGESGVVLGVGYEEQGVPVGGSVDVVTGFPSTIDSGSERLPPTASPEDYPASVINSISHAPPDHQVPTRPRSAMDGLTSTTKNINTDVARPGLHRSRTQSSPSPATNVTEAPGRNSHVVDQTSQLPEVAAKPSVRDRARRADGRKQKRDARIVLEEVDAADFHDLLHYVYPNLTCNITWKNVAGLLSLSQRLDVAPLQKACIIFLDTHVAGKPMQALQIAESYGLADLYREASRFVLDSMDDQQPADWALLSSDTIIKLERRKNWFLDRLLKLQLVSVYRDYVCHPNCQDPAHCARILDDRWRQAFLAISRFGSPQPSIVFRNARQLETTPPLAMTHTACQSAAKAWVASLFDRMFSLSGGIGSSVTKRHFLYINLHDPMHAKQ